MTLHLVSDFNIGVLQRHLQAQAADIFGTVDEGLGVGQAMPSLIRLREAATASDCAFVWCSPESLFPEIAQLRSGGAADAAQLDAKLEELASQLKAIASRARFVLMAEFENTFEHPGFGLLDWRGSIGLRHALARINLRLAELMAGTANFYLVNPLAGFTGERYSPKLWHVAKTPHSNAAYKHVAAEIARAVDAMEGRSRRLVILDLDDTLWGGIVGEVTWTGLRLGGHDYIGESYKAFQQALKALTRTGVQLAIVSKNDEAVALEAIDSHGEMVLRRSDFAGWRINWRDKGQNVLDLLADIRLGAASAVYIDDNPVERERVRQAVPGILVPDWPADPTRYVEALHQLRCFDVATMTTEDRARTQMYAQERERKELLDVAGSMDQWLQSLQTRVRVEPLQPGNIARVTQLFNKTNQLNLSTRRMQAAELESWARGANRDVLAFHVSDRFGELGLTGMLGLECEGGEAFVVDYVLSCRVMGRKVEETLFHVAAQWARARSARTMTATYVPTERNRPTLDVLQKSGIPAVGDNRFVWDCTQPYPLPQHVTLETTP